MTYEELLAENICLRTRIRELEQENARLKGSGSSLLCEPEPPQYGSGPVRLERDRNTEIQRRLDIFRGLFRGREDVFAQRFVSKAGKAGYQPVCKNRWSDGCVEHKYKCEGCLFREFVPLEESVIRQHLDKVTKTYETQRQAQSAARAIAIKEKSEVVIHRPNGQIRNKDSYGNDSYPPKG